MDKLMGLLDWEGVGDEYKCVYVDQAPVYSQCMKWSRSYNGYKFVNEIF